MVVVTTAYLVVTYRILRATEGALASTIESRNIAERAWLITRPIGAAPSTRPHAGRNVLNIPIENTGHSPATDIVMKWVARAPRQPPRADPGWYATAHDSRSRFVLGPTGTTYSQVSYQLSEADAQDIATGSETLFVSGFAAYNTICDHPDEPFPFPRVHVTHACYRWDPAEQQWWRCEEGNEAY